MTNHGMKTYLFTTAAMALCTVASCFTGGLLQLIMGILISSLLGLQVTKHHFGYWLASSSLVLLIPIVFAAILGGSSFADALLYGALLMVPVLLMGIALGFSANLKLSFYKTVLILTVIYLAGGLINMKIMSSAGSTGFDIEASIYAAISQAQESLEAAYASNPELLATLREVLGELAQTMLTVTPAVLFLLSLLVAYCCTVLFKWIMLRRGAELDFWPAFHQLRADRIVGILFLVFFALSMIAPAGLFSDLLLNVLIILGGIFFVYGYSYFAWELRFRGMKPVARRLLLIACFPLCTMLYMLPALILISLGVTDSIIHLRERRMKTKF